MFSRQLNDRELTHDATECSGADLKTLVQQRTEALRTLSAKLHRVQDEERRHLARELHDSTGQTLAALKLYLGSLWDRLKTGQPTSEVFDQINALADQALKEIRTTSYLLYPPLLDEAGFASATQWYVEGFAKRSNIEVKLQLPSSVPQLLRPIETALFRVLQESLTNIHRHSCSQTAEVRLRLERDIVTLEVQDYGKGIPAEVLEKFNRTGAGVGVGLAGMRERIEEIYGRLELCSGGNGAVVRARVPMAKRTPYATRATGSSAVASAA
jgi:signal transduction histidine kinase